MDIERMLVRSGDLRKKVWCLIEKQCDVVERAEKKKGISLMDSNNGQRLTRLAIL